jgi:hypothetical protein
MPLRLLGSQGGGLLGFARREVGRLLFGSRLGGGKRLISLCSLGFYLRPLGGQAGGICGIIRNQSGKRPRDGGPSILMVFLTYATAALRFRPR